MNYLTREAFWRGRLTGNLEFISLGLNMVLTWLVRKLMKPGSLGEKKKLFWLDSVLTLPNFQVRLSVPSPSPCPVLAVRVHVLQKMSRVRTDFNTAKKLVTVLMWFVVVTIVVLNVWNHKCHCGVDVMNVLKVCFWNWNTTHWCTLSQSPPPFTQMQTHV